jgi:hypothetical protein
MPRRYRAQLDVSLDRLHHTPPAGERSPRGYTQAQMRQWMQHVPTIYRLRTAGYTPAGFARLWASPL